MIEDYNQQKINLPTLIETNLNGSLIGIIEQGSQKITVFFFKGWLIEIHAQLVDQHWTPFSMKYHIPMSGEGKALIHQLTANQRLKIEAITKTGNLN